MLEIFNNLGPFFEDCYIEFGVREYSRIIGVSPPTASVLLKGFEKQGFLKSRLDRGNLLFSINSESLVLRNISCIYWQNKLANVLDFIEEDSFSFGVVLFGSLSKLETKLDSDIDLVVFSKHKKELDFSRFEKKLKRKIQVFYFESFDKVSENLVSSVLNGFVLRGKIE